jgi:transcriptional regulator GlxA family with amidase domain
LTSPSSCWTAAIPSTAIGPIEVFHSAGLLWNRLHGEKEEPRFRGAHRLHRRQEGASLCSLGLTPQCAIRDIRKTDIIILPASGLDLHERIARNTALLPWLRRWHARGAFNRGHLLGCRVPRGGGAPRRPPGDHPLGGGRIDAPAAIRR